MHLLKSFNYVADESSIILILGSMPGEESLRKKEYYGYPGNLFWDILGEFLGFSKELSYHDRLEKLKQNRIALWDVVCCCRRKGSLDTKIENKSIIFNDIGTFLNKYPAIEYIFFNGKKAEMLFKRMNLNISEKIELCYLPSTSPANASISRRSKIEAWSIIKEKLQENIKKLEVDNI